MVDTPLPSTEPSAPPPRTTLIVVGGVILVGILVYVSLRTFGSWSGPGGFFSATSSPTEPDKTALERARKTFVVYFEKKGVPSAAIDERWRYVLRSIKNPDDSLVAAWAERLSEGERLDMTSAYEAALGAYHGVATSAPALIVSPSPALQAR